LGKKASAQVRQILDSQPPDSCQVEELGPLAKIAKWPDDIRGQEPATGPWHYLDVPLPADRSQLPDLCSKEGCVTGAIGEQVKALGLPGAGHARALMFLVHFVGDLHQPLHSATNNDRGGNCVPVTYFNRQPRIEPGSERVTGNLHAVWDTDIVRRLVAGSTKPVPAGLLGEFAAQLNAAFAPHLEAWSTGAPDDWAWESHQKALSTVYGQLTPQAPVATTEQSGNTCADHGHIALQLAKLDIRLGKAYQDAAEPVIREQLAKGGFRLARLLNRLWPD